MDMLLKLRLNEKASPESQLHKSVLAEIRVTRIGQHSCFLVLMKPNIPVKFLAANSVAMEDADSSVTPATVRAHCRNDHGVDVQYRKAHCAQEQAKIELHGDEVGGYKKLRYFCKR
ncbi:hypothetical protein PsorP6_010616 [Peronosclerospora sorghi]|uniref:Uncharacterized protein n=1 Tax=Peronosclerospora sorghi TaxID=230839 RepID=A0ACC0VX22_9STRA|nr:hypothetical protein PsorP6_010616 [Peronosclerospora sorghi]